MGNNPSSALVFISYASPDQAIAKAACEELETNGIRCWMAPRDVKPGVAYAGQIIQGLRESRVVVLLFSQHANRSANVLREIEFAANQNLTVLAVRLDRTVMSDDFAYYLRVVQWHNVSGRDNDQERVADLPAQVTRLFAIVKPGEESRASAVAAAARFGDFEILAAPDGRPVELGRGGMGVTYRARQISMGGREVALKVINPQLLGDDGIRKRFLREAQIAGAIEHPNVALVYSRGQEDDSYFYAMQLVPGVDLDKYVKEHGPLSVAQALSVTAQVAAALEAARAKGLIHRDIKPGNIMAAEDRRNRLRIKLIDFGLAKNVGGANTPQSVVSGDQFIGTFAFASPEQCRRQELDTRSDLYSLGVALWFLLTGKAPFLGTPEEVSGSHLFQDPPFDKLPPLPPRVIELLKSLLAKDPAKRPQTPGELEDRVEELLRSLPIDSSAPPSELTPDGQTTLVPASSHDAGLHSLIGSPVLSNYLGPAVGQTREQRFHLLEELREGVSGRLFRAREDRGTVSREVGLKFLHPSIVSNDENQKLLREQFDRVRSLTIEHLLVHYSLELGAQPPFLVREWLNGFSLSALLRWKQSLSAQELIKLLAPLPVLLDQLSKHLLALIEVSLGKIFLVFPPEVSSETFPVLAKNPVEGLRHAQLKLNPLSLRGLARRSGDSDSDPTMLSTSRLLALSQAKIGIRGKPPVPLLGKLIYELLSGYPYLAQDTKSYTPLSAINEAGNRLLRAAILAPAAAGGFPDCHSFWQAFTPSLYLAPKATPSGIPVPPKAAPPAAPVPPVRSDQLAPRNTPPPTPAPPPAPQPPKAPSVWPTQFGSTIPTQAPSQIGKAGFSPAKKQPIWMIVWILLGTAVVGLGLLTVLMFSVGPLIFPRKNLPANTATPAPSVATAEASPQTSPIVEATPQPSPTAETPKQTTGQSPAATTNLTDLFNQAYREAQGKQYDKAVADYTEAIRIKPDFVEAYNGRGEAYFNLKQYDKAIADYSEAIRLKPDFAEAYSNRSFAYDHTNQFEKALADCNEAIRLKPDFAEAYKNRANPYNNLNQFDKAIADCNEALRLKPDFAEAYANRAWAYVGLKQYDKAIADCNEAIRLKPELFQAYAIRGFAYGDKGQHDQAIADFTEAIRINPDFVEAIHNRGLNYYFLKQYDKALADFTEAIRIKPDFVFPHLMRGMTYSMLKQYDEAIVDFTEASRLKSDDADSYAYRAEAYNKLQQYEKAVADCNEAIRLRSGFADAYTYRAEAYDNLKQYDKAVADAAEAIRLKPDSAEAYDYRAWGYAGLMQYDKAMTDCNEAIRLNPDLADAYGNRGAVYSSLGQYEKAVADLTKAISLKSDFYDAYAGRGLAYINLKQFEKAIADLTEAIRLNPDLSYAFAFRAAAENDLKQYAKAISDCNEAIRLDPTNATAYNNRGYAYNNLRRYDDAVADCTEAIRLNSNLAPAYFNRAFAYQQLGQTQKAKTDRAMAEKLQGAQQRTQRQGIDRPAHR